MTGIPKCEFIDRVKKLRKLMETFEFDAFFIYSDEYRPGNVLYIANYKPIDMVPESPVAVFIPLDGELVLFTGSLNILAAKRASWIKDVRSIWSLHTYLINLPKMRKVGVVGENIMPVSIYRKLIEGLPETKLEDVSRLFIELRQVKSDNEIVLLRKAAKIGDHCINTIIQEIDIGKNEMELTAFAEYTAKLNSAEIGSAFIVSSGARTSSPVIRPSNRKIRKGEFVMLDFSPCFEGYCNDVSRTVVVGNVLTKEQKKILLTTRDVFTEVVDSIKPGIKIDDLYNIAYRMVKQAGYEKNFEPYVDHGAIGHSIGLDVTEEPFLSPDSKIILESNMVLAIKIGLYGFKFGGVRIESVIQITKKRAELLNKCKLGL